MTVIGPLLLALVAADAGASAPSQLALNSGVCPSPQEELPPGLARVVRAELLLPQHDVRPILYVAVFPPFTPPRALQLEMWSIGADTARMQLRVVKLAESRGRRARRARTRVEPVDPELARLLEEVWAAALARTQHVAEVLEARHPNGSRTIVRRGDGSYYVLWHRDRSGFTSTDDPGTPLGELVAASDALAAYVEAAPPQRPALLAALEQRLRPLPKRFASEGCLRPR